MTVVPAHWAVRCRQGLVAGIDQNGRIFFSGECGAFQVFQTLGQAEEIAKILEHFGGEIVEVACRLQVL